MYITVIFGALVALASVQGKDRKFLLKNNCKEPVWPGIHNTAPPAVPIQGPLGFQLEPGAHRTLTVSDHWGGRIWPRTKCATKDGKWHCQTGDCEGTEEQGCHPSKTGEVCTLGEWTLATENPSEAGPFSDWYDLSLVDGFSIPMQILPSTKQCKTLTCALDLMPFCPPELLGGFNNATCLSSCKTGSALGKYVFTDPDGSKTISDGDRNCCTGPFAVPQTCSLDMIDYYHFFKKGCPDAYAHAYDDETSLHTCDKALQPDYTITFCPEAGTTMTPPPSQDPSYAASNVCVPKGYRLESGGGAVKPTKNCVPVVPKGPKPSASIDPNAYPTENAKETVASDTATSAATQTPPYPTGTGDDAVYPAEPSLEEQNDTSTAIDTALTTGLPSSGETPMSLAISSTVLSSSVAPAAATSSSGNPPAGTSAAGTPPADIIATDAAQTSVPESSVAVTASSSVSPSKAPKLSCRERKKRRAALKRTVKAPAVRRIVHEQL